MGEGLPGWPMAPLPHLEELPHPVERLGEEGQQWGKVCPGGPTAPLPHLEELPHRVERLGQEGQQ